MLERRRCCVVYLQRIGCAQVSAFSGSPVRPEALLPARPNVDGLHHLRNGTQIVSHLTQGPVIQMSMDPTIIEESELPEYFEACVRTELSYWLRSTPVSRVARAQVMRRIGPLPDWAPAALQADAVETICHVMGPLLAAETKQLLGRMAPWLQFVILKAAATFAPLWRRRPDAVVRMLSDMALDAMDMAARRGSSQ